METNETVAQGIRQYLSENFLFTDEGFPYDDDASFMELGVVDSLGIAELLAFVEEEFGIAVADHELVPDNFDSVEKLTDFVVRKQAMIA